MSSELTTAALVDIDLPLPGRRAGKVRVSYDWAEGQRLSADELLKELTGSPRELEAIVERTKELVRA